MSGVGRIVVVAGAGAAVHRLLLTAAKGTIDVGAAVAAAEMLFDVHCC